VKTTYSLILIMVLAGTFTACRKDNNPDKPISPTDGSREQLTLDSIYLYAREMYLWYDALPDYNTFNPRQYATGGSVLTNYKHELYLISQLKVNPSTNLPYEYSGYPNTAKYSFMEEGSPTTGTSGAVSLADKGDDYGLAFTAVSANDVRIRYVNPSSAADKAGLTRGDQVVKVNGTTVTSSSSSFIENAFTQASVTMSVNKTNGTTQDLTLKLENYTTSPIFKSSVLTVGASQKVGYIAVSRFSTPGSFKDAALAVFNGFATAGVTALVVDLRYNGGGYTQSAQDLVNMIAPSTLNGKRMYVEYFNTLMQNGNAPILKQQLYLDANGKPVTIGNRNATYADVDYSVNGNSYNFSKLGNLQGVKQVVFIVSGNTASASELTINSLKPYLPVKLVGQQTYGKPVGFFGIKIDKYTVYLSSFSMQNANGEGDYFHGMTPDMPANDDVTRDFGVPTETCLASALDYIAGNPAGRAGTTEVQAPVHMGPVTSFTGMIENRMKLKQ
jgi:carboxyl-terminal processing protease